MSDTCPICSGGVRTIVENHPGYQEGQRYSIRACEACGASHSWPLASNDVIYDRIYEQIRLVPGYNRYDLYSQQVLSARDPLLYLSEQEESYWAVVKHLRSAKRSPARTKVLEIGCGRGYFAFALARAGFNILGVDISPKAVAWATDHYGPHYTLSSARELQTRGDRYDVVIMNQLIEHVPDVHALLADAVALLADDGELLITTPNKTAFPGASWETDLPPVHLWWLGENTMRCLAERHGCAVSFVDFTEYVDTHFRAKGLGTGPVHQPILDKDGGVIVRQEVPSPGTLKRLLERSGMLETARGVRALLSGTQRWRGSRGPVLAAVMRKLSVRKSPTP